jgi:quercetin dioxygenase-like cupin family protein
MGVLDRSQKTISSKHYHPYGEFGFVIDGAVTIETADQGTMTLEAGSSFHQAPGKWHVVSTPDTGARTVLFRIVKKGDPMIVEVD